MSKFLFWAAVILVALLVVRLMARHSAAKTRAARRGRERGRPRRLERMVQCAHCGVHLPEQDAVTRDGRTWCSLEHARRGLPR